MTFKSQFTYSPELQAKLDLADAYCASVGLTPETTDFYAVDVVSYGREAAGLTDEDIEEYWDTRVSQWVAKHLA